MADAPQMKPWIEGIEAYVPGKSTGADGRPLIKLSANENPLGTSPATLAARAAAGSPALYPDPDCVALRNAIGALHGIDPARIVCGTGSGELLHGAVQAFAGTGDEVLFSRYSFSLYPLLAQKVAATPVMAADADYAASVDALLANVSATTRVVLLDNPNNPVGSWLPAPEVARLHAALPRDVLLIIDQAYAEFLGEDEDDGGLALAARHDNVLVSRTFSKAYGLAGERVGWVTGAPALIDAVNRLRGAFNVSVSGQAAALAALADRAWLAEACAANAQAREEFVVALSALGNRGVRPLPSKANFVLVEFSGALSGQAAYKGLAERGFITRWLPGQGLPHCLRITIGTGPQMMEVAAILRDLAEAAR
ncbi:histidinol-phosphate transaminase [Novosphingobium sp. Gsoil 351]|uniref:pyridoxal phosphate-dependent aminotransferase n=1 Tax=Novosphingobium sp. Gsoil 351 TaxID=2675225 RepID=UPI0012B4C96C|nr:histidinol-phosphate transaminase [Novosphingobium sp. Gsoil 351]QGN55058.1 aminotransferase class I/II-fold pyridoxal phosphate-dependent enzyme [Novosphingobium sp. Gsoil 351]